MTSLGLRGGDVGSETPPDGTIQVRTAWSSEVRPKVPNGSVDRRKLISYSCPSLPRRLMNSTPIGVPSSNCVP